MRIAGFINSIGGRVTIILMFGMVAAIIGSLFVAEQIRVRDFKRVNLEEAVASAADIADRLTRNPAQTEQLLHENRIFGAREAPATWRMSSPDSDLDGLLAARFGPRAEAQAMLMPRKECFPRFDLAIRAAGMSDQSIPDCWFIRFKDQGGAEHRLAVDMNRFRIPPNSTLAPMSIFFVVCASAVLSFLVARASTAPLRRLTSAARAFSVTIDPQPIPEEGPAEVRAALQTFNIMQLRVREGFRERTQILASIAHDLQTPLTRLRLRLEHVGEEAVRARLIADLAAMQHLVRVGLDLARSSESREPWSRVHVDSILSSVAEDAAECGNSVSFTGGCGVLARIKPNALARCLNNLTDNAVKYGGGAELSCAREGGDLVIRVRDHGPGIPEERIEEALQSFRRLDGGGLQLANGTGIGLAIARAQAQTFGATLGLQNHPEGGMLATVRLKLD
jgi:signal transduction histidine kinase